MNNKKYKAIIGLQGDAKALEQAIKERDILYSESFKMNDGYEVRRDKVTKIVYINTWEDKLSNLSLVFNRVKNSSNCPKILAMKVGKSGRKGRRDFYVLSENNQEFEKLFSITLAKMVEEYKEKQASLYNIY